jgi:hypothetical protein
MTTTSIYPTTLKTTQQVPTKEKDLRAFFNPDGKVWWCQLMDLDGNCILDENKKHINAYGMTKEIAYKNVKIKIGIA